MSRRPGAGDAGDAGDAGSAGKKPRVGLEDAPASGGAGGGGGASSGPSYAFSSSAGDGAALAGYAALSAAQRKAGHAGNPAFTASPFIRSSFEAARVVAAAGGGGKPSAALVDAQQSLIALGLPKDYFNASPAQKIEEIDPEFILSFANPGLDPTYMSDVGPPRAEGGLRRSRSKGRRLNQRGGAIWANLVNWMGHVAALPAAFYRGATSRADASIVAGDRASVSAIRTYLRFILNNPGTVFLTACAILGVTFGPGQYAEMAFTYVWSQYPSLMIRFLTNTQSIIISTGYLAAAGGLLRASAYIFRSCVQIALAIGRIPGQVIDGSLVAKIREICTAPTFNIALMSLLTAITTSIAPAPAAAAAAAAAPAVAGDARDAVEVAELAAANEQLRQLTVLAPGAPPIVALSPAAAPPTAAAAPVGSPAFSPLASPAATSPITRAVLETHVSAGTEIDRIITGTAASRGVGELTVRSAYKPGQHPDSFDKIPEDMTFSTLVSELRKTRTAADGIATVVSNQLLLELLESIRSPSTQEGGLTEINRLLGLAVDDEGELGGGYRRLRIRNKQNKKSKKRQNRKQNSKKSRRSSRRLRFRF